MSKGSMTLESPDTIFDSERELADEIGEMLATYTGWAGLEDFCKDGGVVHDVEADVKLDDYDEHTAEITGSFHVTFEERYNQGCKDITWSNCFRGHGTLTIDTASGEVTVETTAKLTRSKAEEAEMEEKFIEEMEREAGKGDVPEPF